MNRIQKKCLTVSVGIHLLLAVILIVGPALMPEADKPQSMELLPWIPALASDGPTGGGGQNMRPPSHDTQDSQPIAPVPSPPVVAPPVVTPPPEPKPKPDVVKAPTPEPPKIVKPVADAVEPVKPPKHTVTVNTDLVTASKNNDQAAKEAAAAKKAADRAAKQAAEQQRLAAAFSRASHSLQGRLAGGTDVKFNQGFGGSGPAYANWQQIVQTIYQNDWNDRKPSGASDEILVGTAIVTISRDGTVLSSRISKSTGNAAVDRAIQSVLDHVKITHAFPENWNKDQIEQPINFTLDPAKQLMG